MMQTRFGPGLAALLLAFGTAAAAASATAPAKTPAAAPAEKHPGMTALIAEIAASDAAAGERARALLEAAVYQPAIIEAISKPAEAKPWSAYRPIFLTEDRIAGGIKFWSENQAALTEAEEHFGVPAHYIVSIIGVETLYGRIAGKWKVIDALTTLGLYYPPRQEFFRAQLKRYLTLDNAPGIQFDRLNALGSYAGAMGLGQFMPTSYADFAVDFNADGHIDLWGQNEDVIGSVANYFRQHGWVAAQPVTASVMPVPGATPPPGLTLEPDRKLKDLLDWGFAPPGDLDPEQASTLLTLEGAQGTEYFAIFGNFRVITKYNRSPLYAMAVHQLAEELRTRMAPTLAAVGD